jgi:tetratricopeptide (TPR) repeat protein
VIPSGKPPVLMKTPAAPPFAQDQSTVMIGTLSKDAVFTGRLSAHFRSDSEVFLRIGYRSVSEAQWKDLTQRLSQMMNYAGEVSNVKISSPSDTSQPFSIQYDYLRKDYGNWESKEIPVPLPPLGIEASGLIVKAPRKPIPLGAVCEIVYESKVELPAGAKIEPPQQVSLSESFADYAATSQFSAGILTTIRRLVIKKTEVPVKDWESLRKFAKAVNDDEYSFLAVQGLEDRSPKNAENDAKKSLLEDSSAPKTLDRSELDAKFREGQEALMQRDSLRAQELFQQIIKADPNYHGAHLNLGASYVLQARYQDALRNIHEEETVPGGDERSFNAAALLEIMLGLRDQAMEDWRRLIKADPKNRDAPLQLSGMLIQDGNSGEAIDILNGALKASPDSTNLELQLARAYAKSAQPENAKSYLRKATDPPNELSSFDSDLLTPVALALADAGISLDRAERFASELVSRAESASLSDASAEISTSTSAVKLSSAWDALGWVYFRRGDSARGESYVRSAWILGQSDAAGYHLGQIYEKNGRLKDAAHQYGLAVAASALLPATNKAARTNHDLALARYVKLTGKAPSSNLERLPNGTFSVSPAEELGRMRSFKIGATGGHNGSAEFTLVFGPAGDESFKSQAGRLTQAHYPVEFPVGSKTKFVRRAMLSCHEAEGCNVVLMPLPQATPRPF